MVRQPQGSLAEVFRVFLGLGLTSFGGPTAHLGHFRKALVVRRRWLRESEYVELLALAQLLPGPTSSQVGFAIGHHRAGLGGGLMAFLGFTLPSVALLLLAAAMLKGLPEGRTGALLHGLTLVPVAIVAHALVGMARTLAPTGLPAMIALGALAVATLLPGPAGHVLAILGGAGAGLLVGRDAVAAGAPAPRAPALAVAIPFALFLALLVLLPIAAPLAPAIALADAFYRPGALVFGGGHVILPLLEAQTVGRGWIDRDTFLAAYGAAQAVLGPLNSIAAALGALRTPVPNGIAGALIATVAIFLPGFLLMLAAMPAREMLRGHARVASAMAGASAAVVGLLALAFFDPVLVDGVNGGADALVALVGIVALLRRTPHMVVVVGTFAAGSAAAALGIA